MKHLHHFVILAGLAAAGCGAKPAQGCRDDSECSAGACVAGQCRPLVATEDLGTADGSGEDLAGPSPDGNKPPLDLAPPPDGQTPSCAFNGDGVLERTETPFLPGLGGLFAVNAVGSTVPVSVIPKGGGWDFSAPVGGERKVFDQLLAPGGQWWSADFPTATFAERIDDGLALYGVFRASADRLELLGVVSDQGGLQKTELTYATAIPVLKFPLAKSNTWTAESTLSGFVQGVIFAASEKYAFTVDARGETLVPAGKFDTLRVRMNSTQTYGLLVTKRIQYLHLAECFGAVARIRSKDNEASADFTQASEYRRLATQ
ncbi:MAG: hypothetical protein EXR72_22345 [Myxococcales bacterium]|nr:hypothetical protein [Myxococcales bacterium]